MNILDETPDYDNPEKENSELLFPDAASIGPANISAALFDVADVADRLNLKPVRSGGKMEWHGPNPHGDGAEKDGFIVFQEGTAWDRKTGERYTSAQVAEMAGMTPDMYVPYRQWRERHAEPHGFNGIRHQSQVESTPVHLRSLGERGIRAETQAYFQIRREGEGYQYPTYFADGKRGRDRWKACDSNSKTKYKWAGSKAMPIPPETAMPPGYHLNGIQGPRMCGLLPAKSMYGQHGKPVYRSPARLVKGRAILS